MWKQTNWSYYITFSLHSSLLAVFQYTRGGPQVLPTINIDHHPALFITLLLVISLHNPPLWLGYSPWITNAEMGSKQVRLCSRGVKCPGDIVIKTVKAIMFMLIHPIFMAYGLKGQGTHIWLVEGPWPMPLYLERLLASKIVSCYDRDTWSTLYHSVQSRPRVYRPFHCMYLHFPIVSIFLVSLPIGERFVQSVFPYDYLICFHLRSRLLSVPVPLYLLIWYASGNRPRTSPGLLIALRWLSACPTPRASPCTFYNSI